MVAVSHDRYFLDKIASSILEVRDGGEVRRTMGGYSDYLVQRTAEEKSSAKAGPKEAPSRERRSDRPQKLKFSFREQREFDTIDADIAALEAQIADCEAAIAASASDYVRLQELLSQKEALEKQLEEKTERWVYLNDLAERIAQQNQ